jgi:dienelactone hydrolase
MWAQRLADWGYVALVLDSFGPRGASDVCYNAMRVPPYMRTIDTYQAAEYLRSLPIVGDQKIGAIGFSHGGWTVIQLRERAAASVGGRPIDAIVSIYPWCESETIRHLDAPTLILIGEDDDWTPADRCKLAQEYLRIAPERPEVEIEFVYYPGARHAYDVPGLNAAVQGVAAGVVTTRYLQYNRDAAQDTERRAREWFGQHLKR